MAGLPQPEPLPNPRMSAFASCGHPSHRLWPASCRLWGASSPEDKLAGDLGNVIECARQSWCDPAGASPAQVRSSVRLVASVAGPLATVVAKRTQRLHGVWD